MGNSENKRRTFLSDPAIPLPLPPSHHMLIPSSRAQPEQPPCPPLPFPLRLAPRRDAAPRRPSCLVAGLPCALLRSEERTAAPSWLPAGPSRWNEHKGTVSLGPLGGLLLPAEKELSSFPGNSTGGPGLRSGPGQSPSDEHNLYKESPPGFQRLKLITEACLPVMMEGRGLFSHLFKAPEPSMSQAMCRDALLIFP